MKSILVILFSLLSFSVFAAPVNINKAGAEQIAKSLAGIGIKKAQAIVDYREKHGEFSLASDLTKVKGIGSKTFEKNKTDILLKD